MTPHARTPYPLDDLCSETAALGRRLVMWLLAIALAGFCATAFAAPRAESGEECSHPADLAVTARALAEEGISREQAAKVVARMYPKALIAKWAEAVLKAAYADSRPAAKFASDLIQHCYKSQGDLDGFLGVAL